jgi:hypothetical protein
MRKKRCTKWLISACLVTLVTTMRAQDGPPPIDPPPPSDCYPDDPDPDPNDECIPIDGGLAFLLVAGVGYGILRNRPTHRNDQDDTSESTQLV